MVEQREDSSSSGEKRQADESEHGNPSGHGLVPMPTSDPRGMLNSKTNR